MIIQVNNSIRLDTISRQFREQFPFLKLAFFKQSHAAGDVSNPRQLLPEDQTIAAVKTTLQEGSLEIHAWHTTAAVEKAFLDYFVPVQVLRRRGNDWLQTSLSDKLSLAEQNTLAASLEEEMLYGSDRQHEQGRQQAND